MAKHTYNWTNEDEALIASIVEDEGCTQTEAIRKAIRAYVSDTDGSTSDTYVSDRERELLESQIGHLRAQVEWQRRLIEQQVGLIAQAQATAERALPSAEERRGGWRWPWSR